MFGAGHLGDQLPLRGFLVAGMVLSGAAVCAVGAAFFLDVHELWFFVVVQVLGGAPPPCLSHSWLDLVNAIGYSSPAQTFLSKSLDTTSPPSVYT